MKHLSFFLIASLIFLSSCSLKQSQSGNTKPLDAAPANINDNYIPPKVGDFTRVNTPESGFNNNYDVPDINRENLAALYTVPNDKDKLSFKYVKLSDDKSVKNWIEKMVTHATEDCKDMNPEDLKSTQEQDSHYKIVKRESRAGGEIIVMHKDPKLLCNKGQKEEYEKVYFVRGDTIFLALRYGIKNYGAAEQFMNEFLKTR